MKASFFLLSAPLVWNLAWLPATSLIKDWGGYGTNDECRKQCLWQKEQEVQRTMGIHECGYLWPARGKKWRSFGQAKSECYMRSLDLIPKK